MTLRNLISQSLSEILSEHPGYFTPRGQNHAHSVMLKKLMQAIRDSTKEDLDNETQAPSDESALGAKFKLLDPTEDRAIAYATLRIVAGAVAPLMLSGKMMIPAEGSTPAVWAFADAPKPERWGSITDRRQIAAWMQFLANALPNVARRPVLTCHPNGVSTLRVPWPWPPNKDGSVHEPREEEIEV